MMYIRDVLKSVIKRSGGDPCRLQLVDYGDCRLLCYDPFGEIPLEDDWLLKSMTDEESVLVLNRFLDGDTDCAHDLLCQFARLLVEKGGLIRSRLQGFYQEKDWSSYSAPHLTLSGLVHLSDAATCIRKLLDVVPEDCRDGLLLACWYLNDLSVNKRLCEKFEEWSKDLTWGGGDGEDYWLARFVSKWTEKSVFSPERLRHLKMWCVEHGIEII